MNRFISRILSFALDIILCSIIIVLVSMIPIFNKNITKLNYEYSLQRQSYEVYNGFKEESKKIVKDSVINEKEMKMINGKYAEYKSLFKGIKTNESLSESFISNLEVNINKKYQEIENKYNYKINKYMINENIIAIIVYILYFGFLAYFLKGQTLFKKLFRLRVIDNKDEDKKVSLISFIIRAILISEVIFIIVRVLLSSLTSESVFTTYNYYLSLLKYIYELTFILTMLIRDDNRSIHDLILNTKVIKYDKSGNIIDKPIFNLEEK